MKKSILGALFLLAAVLCGCTRPGEITDDDDVSSIPALAWQA